MRSRGRVSRRNPSAPRPSRSRAFHALQQAALAEVREQPGEPAEPASPRRRSDSAISSGSESHRRGAGPARIVVAEPQEGAGLEVPEDPAAVALGRRQALERVARAHARARAELGRLGRGHRRARGHDDRAARLSGVAGALDRQLGVAEPDPRPVAQLHRPAHALAVHERPVRRARVLDHRSRAVGGPNARMQARDRGVGQHHARVRCAAERELGHQRHARRVVEHQLEHGCAIPRQARCGAPRGRV